MGRPFYKWLIHSHFAAEDSPSVIKQYFPVSLNRGFDLKKGHGVWVLTITCLETAGGEKPGVTVQFHQSEDLTLLISERRWWWRLWFRCKLRQMTAVAVVEWMKSKSNLHWDNLKSILRAKSAFKNRYNTCRCWLGCWRLNSGKCCRCCWSAFVSFPLNLQESAAIFRNPTRTRGSPRRTPCRGNPVVK